MSGAKALDFSFVRLAAKYLDALMAIEVEAYPDAWSRNMFLQELRLDNSHFYVLLQGEEVAGYGGFWLVLDEAHITSVTVKDTLRGRGLGRRLMEYLLEIARCVSAQVATLEVRGTNVLALNLYESMGFRRTGIRKNYYPSTGEDALVMALELGSRVGGRGTGCLG